MKETKQDNRTNLNRIKKDNSERQTYRRFFSFNLTVSGKHRLGDCSQTVAKSDVLDT